MNVNFLPQELKFVAILSERSPECVSFEDLTRHLWDRPCGDPINVMRVMATRVRGKLRDADADITVRNIRGFGYALVSK